MWPQGSDVAFNLASSRATPQPIGLMDRGVTRLICVLLTYCFFTHGLIARKIDRWWLCTLVWRSPQHRTLRDTYDLFVTTDGCYTATVSGENLGGPILQTPDGGQVRNLLYTFEGCFDTT